MVDGDEDFLSRWSRLKREQAADAAPAKDAAAVPATAEAPRPLSAADLPPIDSLTLESDYGAFLQPGVGKALRQSALKKLFSDPHFHFDQMDKLDTYIDDYSIEDPISEEMMKTLDHARHILFDEPKKPEVVEAPSETAEPQQDNVDPKQDA
ncbi:MAG: DUF3306 domain-containing protein [Candidatus Parcubacteria bacterium]|nr:DUF3306 domain-containing protein [Burkholderiales bacterium]